MWARPSCSVTSHGPTHVLREAQPVGPAALPGPRGRHPDEVDPQPEITDEPGTERAQLLHGLRAVREGCAQLVRVGEDLGLALVDGPGPDRPVAPGTADAHGVGPELAARDHVDGRAHQGRLDDAPVLERGGQRLTVEILRVVSTARHTRTARTASASRRPVPGPRGSASWPVPAAAGAPAAHGSGLAG